MAKAEKKQKAREAALQLPVIAEDKAGPSDTGKVAATPEAAPQHSVPAEDATAKLKPKKKKAQQASSSPEQHLTRGNGAADLVALPISPTGPADAILANFPALASSSQPLTTSSGLANGHKTRRQPSPVARMPARPYLPPAGTADDSAAGWTVVNGHQRHAEPAAAHTAPADPFSADPFSADFFSTNPCWSDVPWGEQPMEEFDQVPEDPDWEKIGLAAMEGHAPLRRRGVRAGKRHKRRLRDASADDDSDHTDRGHPTAGQPSWSPLAGQSTSWGVPDASNSPVRGIGLPPGLPVEINHMQAEQNIRQIRKANALQAAQAAEAAKQDAVQRAHAAAETRRQADSMAMQQPADDWPALLVAGSSLGQPASNAHCSCLFLQVTVV